jgi:hypothetical protein
MMESVARYEGLVSATKARALLNRDLGGFEH